VTAVPTVSVIVVSYNTREKTIAALRSLHAEHVDGGMESIVVDNDSHDGSAEAIAASGFATQVIPANSNLGFARAVNLGIRAAGGRFVLLLNPDTLVLEGSIRALVAFAEANPRYGVYGGRTLKPDGSTDPSSCWGAPTMWSMITYAAGLSSIFRGSRFWDPESLGRWARDSVREVPIITGCLLLMRRADWLRIGGMDERYFLYGEDAEFSSRARRSGFRPVVVPEAVIVHEVGASTGSSGRKMSMVFAGRSTFLRTEWGPFAASVGVGLLQAGALLRSVGERARRRRDGTWTTVWRRRRDWRDGYPSAHHALFAAHEERVA
jgi:N-acetylglucosaminyl-diphospho-decaprenol L-rhamnosyltransferase